MQVNAYRQRFPEKARSITRKTTIPADQLLLVSYRGSASNNGLKLKRGGGISEFEFLSYKEVESNATEPSAEDGATIIEGDCGASAEDEPANTGGECHGNTGKGGDDDINHTVEGNSNNIAHGATGSDTEMPDHDLDSGDEHDDGDEEHDVTGHVDEEFVQSVYPSGKSALCSHCSLKC